MKPSSIAGSASPSSLQARRLLSSGGASGAVCQQCGGSGMLRIGDQRYRTCLECLGQGQLLRPTSVNLYLTRISVTAGASAAG